MKLEWLRADLASTRRASALLAALLLLSMLATVLLTVLVWRQSGRERVVLVPPTLHKTFWVDGERASAEYLEQMAYFLAQLTLNVTPQNVEHQGQVLLRYASPEAYGELRTALTATAARIKRDGASTVFSAQDLLVDEPGQRVGIRGMLTTFISDRRVAQTVRGYQVELQYAGGRIFLKSLRETDPHDPLQTQARKSPAASAADGAADPVDPAVR